MDRKHEKYDRLIERAKALPPLATAVAYPCDESSLAGAVEAARKGLIAPILVGPARKIKEIAAKFGIDLDRARDRRGAAQPRRGRQSGRARSRRPRRGADERVAAHRRD